jgi:hypothetical protein
MTASPVRCGLAVCLALLGAVPGARADGWPSLTKAPAAAGGGENDAALIVAVEKYTDVPEVRGAVQNAKDWYWYLTETRKVPVENIKLLTDHGGTVEAMRKAAAAMAALTRPTGTMWLIFIGHGAPAQDGTDGVLVGADAQQDADSLYARSLKQGEILSILGKGRQSHTVAIVDACFSGQVAKDKPLVPGLQPLIAVRSRKLPPQTTVLAAGRSNEFAGPLPGSERPAFSYLVLGGLRGWADANGDHDVTAAEAVAFARKVLLVTASDRTQTPEVSGDAKLIMSRRALEAAPDVRAIVAGDAASPERSAQPDRSAGTPETGARAQRDPAPPAADGGAIESLVDGAFMDWSARWFTDRYERGSIRITQRQKNGDQTGVVGTFSFFRAGRRLTIPFGAVFDSRPGGFALARLCYNDTTTGMRDCYP